MAKKANTDKTVDDPIVDDPPVENESTDDAPDETPAVKNKPEKPKVKLGPIKFHTFNRNGSFGIYNEDGKVRGFESYKMTYVHPENKQKIWGTVAQKPQGYYKLHGLPESCYTEHDSDPRPKKK